MQMKKYLVSAVGAGKGSVDLEVHCGLVVLEKLVLFNIVLKVSHHLILCQGFDC